MTTLTNIMVYLLKNYPFKNEISNARLTKMVYLADWKHAVKNHSQITNIEWYFDNYGPFVWDILNNAKKYPDLFEVEETKNIFGSPKTLIILKDDKFIVEIPEDERMTLDFVIKTTKILNWEKFIQLVYSTYPILVSERNTHLNLIELARMREIEQLEPPVLG